MVRFPIPMQVKFLCPDAENEVRFENGIGYGDEIICGCCGGVFNTDEVIADAEFYCIPEATAIQEYGMWVNFSDYIGEF
jgi:hypothetical protein